MMHLDIRNLQYLLPTGENTRADVVIRRQRPSLCLNMTQAPTSEHYLQDSVNSRTDSCNMAHVKVASKDWPKHVPGDRYTEHCETSPEHRWFGQNWRCSMPSLRHFCATNAKKDDPSGVLFVPLRFPRQVTTMLTWHQGSR